MWVKKARNKCLIILTYKIISLKLNVLNQIVNILIIIIFTCDTLQRDFTMDIYISKITYVFNY